MENLFTYLFVFGLGLIVVVIYFYRKDRQRVLPLSEQIYQDGRLLISVFKEKGKIKDVVVQVFFKKQDVELSEFFVELMAADKSKLDVSLKPILSEEKKEEDGDGSNIFMMRFSYAALDEMLSTIEHPSVSMRFVAESSEGKKYKSHQLGISDRWGLLKMDSGIYN